MSAIFSRITMSQYFNRYSLAEYEDDQEEMMITGSSRLFFESDALDYLYEDYDYDPSIRTLQDEESDMLPSSTCDAS